MPTSTGDETVDASGRFFNDIATQIFAHMDAHRRQDERLRVTVEHLSEALVRAAAGDLTVQVERDHKGDAADVLAFLVNSTISELAAYVEGAARKAEEDRHRLEALVEQRTRELRRLAITDALTQTFNRRRILELSQEELERCERYGRTFSLAMIDFDHFKQVNDTFGHVVGDEALARCAEAVMERVRRQDRLGRYGGEEFLLLLPGTVLADALIVGHAVREAVADVDLRSRERRVLLTVSVGVAQWWPGDDLVTTLRQADEALYAAKAAGRNRVVSSSELEVVSFAP